MSARGVAEIKLRQYVTGSNDATAKDVVTCMIAAIKEEAGTPDAQGTKISFSEFQDSLLGQIGKAFDMDKEALLGRISWAKPKLIQGYTAEQWQEIIDGGYLCELSVGESYQQSFFSILESAHLDTKFSGNNVYFMSENNGNDYRCCRPAQIKGVMRPIFVEPVDDPYCVFFDLDGKAMHSGMMRFGLRYSYNFKDSNNGRMPTKYIEV